MGGRSPLVCFTAWWLSAACLMNPHTYQHISSKHKTIFTPDTEGLGAPEKELGPAPMPLSGLWTSVQWALIRSLRILPGLNTLRKEVWPLVSKTLERDPETIFSASKSNTNSWSYVNKNRDAGTNLGSLITTVQQWRTNYCVAEWSNSCQRLISFFPSWSDLL